MIDKEFEIHSRDPDEHPLLVLRRKIGHVPLSEAVDRILNTFIVPWKDHALASLDNEEEVSHFLQSVKKNEKQVLSPLALCSLSINNKIAIIVRQSAMQNYSRGTQESLLGFAVYCDFAIGMSLVSNSLLAAEDHIRRGHSPTLEQKMEYAPDLEREQPLSLATATYIKVRDMIQEHSQSLRDDPTGYSLINDIISYRTKNPPRGFLAEPLLMGAKTSGEMYQKLYPIAKGLK